MQEGGKAKYFFGKGVKSLYFFGKVYCGEGEFFWG